MDDPDVLSVDDAADTTRGRIARALVNSERGPDSSRAARCAGQNSASTATTARTSAVVINVTGSCTWFARETRAAGPEAAEGYWRKKQTGGAVPLKMLRR